MGNKKTEKRAAERKRAAKRGSGRVRASESIRKRIPLFNKPRDPWTNQEKKDPFKK